jgi:hypothetical protein
VAFRLSWRAREPGWFNAPVPSFGPHDARLLIVRECASGEVSDVWATDGSFIESSDRIPAIEMPPKGLLHTHLGAPHDVRARVTRGLEV